MSVEWDVFGWHANILNVQVELKGHFAHCSFYGNYRIWKISYALKKCVGMLLVCEWHVYQQGWVKWKTKISKKAWS